MHTWKTINFSRSAPVDELDCFQLFKPSKYSLNFFFKAQQPIAGQGLSTIVASRSQSDIPHSVGLLWTSDQPDAETSTWQHTTHTRQITTPPEGFVPAIPASERLQIHALDALYTFPHVISRLYSKGR